MLFSLHVNEVKRSFCTSPDQNALMCSVLLFYRDPYRGIFLLGQTTELSRTEICLSFLFITYILHVKARRGLQRQILCRQNSVLLGTARRRITRNVVQFQREMLTPVYCVRHIKLVCFSKITVLKVCGSGKNSFFVDVKTIAKCYKYNFCT